MKNNTTAIKKYLRAAFRLSVSILYLGLQNVYSQNDKVLPAPINTVKFTEYAPSISADGRTLIFESDRQGDWKLFESTKNGRTWSVPTSIPKITTTFFEKAPLGGPCISYDGNLLFFSANGKDSDGHEDIYYSIRENGGWSSPMNLGSPINTVDYEGYPSLSADGKYLYFARAKFILGDRKDAQQRCYQIMMSEKGTNGKWQKAVELPSPVNLICEKAPRIMPDGKTLMFSSIRKDGKGNFDIYKCEHQPNGTWTEAVALDFVNTSGPDQFVAVPACGDALYYVQDGDIYKTNLPMKSVSTIQGYVTDSSTNNAIATNIIISEVESPNKIIAEVQSISLDGRFSAVLKPNGKYIFEISESGFYQKKVIVDLSDKEDCQTVEQDFRLTPLSSKTAEIKEVYKLSFLAVDAQTNLTVPATFEAVEINTGQPIVFQYNLSTLQYQGTFRLKENYSIQAAMKGYKNSSLTLRIDDKAELPPVSIIKLDPISSNFIDQYSLNIKVVDAETQKPIKEAIVKVGDLKTLEVKQVIITKNNDFLTSLNRSGVYEIEIKAEDYTEQKVKIDKMPEGSAVNFMLLKKKRLPVNFAVLEAITNKPVKATFHVKLEKEQKSISFKDQTDGVVKVAEREIFTVETSADGYKPKQSTFNMADFSLNKKYIFNIQLEKAIFVLNIKPLNKITNEPVNVEKFTVTDLTVKTNKTDVVRSPTGDATVSLTPENKFRLEIVAEGYEKFEQEISKLSQNELVCRLMPKPKESALVFSAIDSTSGRILDATFRLTPFKTTIQVQGRTSESVPEYKLALNEEDNVAVETFVKGYYIKSEKVHYKTLGKLQKHVVTMSRNFSVLSLKAYDANNNQPIKEVFYNLIDAMTNKPVAAMITLPNGECSADLKPGHEYLIKAKLAGYDDYESRFTASIDDTYKPVKMRILRKYNLFLYAIDARKKSKVFANFRVLNTKGEIVTAGRTNSTRDKMTVVLIEKTNYIVEITANGYKPYEGKIYPDSTMIGDKADIVSEITKDESKFTFRVLDAQTLKIIEKCTAKLTDVKSSQELIISKNGDEFSADLSSVASYLLEFEAPGYVKTNNRIEPNSNRQKDFQLMRIREATVAKPAVLSASVINPKEKLPVSATKGFEKIEKGKTIVLNNVYFEQSSFIMQKESYPELDKVVAMMRANPQTKIEIGGYTDNVGDQRLNLALSENRAKVILNYIVSKGIDEERLFYKGYGGLKSVAPNDSEDNKKKNRRVEIVGIQ